MRGSFASAEFAADLHTVAIGENPNREYADPVAFFQRTYLTEGLTDLLGRALRRISGQAGASPVVNLQTNFGGGKTHSMLALYHLFSGVHAARLPQSIQDIIDHSGVGTKSSIPSQFGGLPSSAQVCLRLRVPGKRTELR